MAINISENTKKVFNQLLKFIYVTTEISYVYVQSGDGIINKYYNRKNLWYNEPNDESGEPNDESDEPDDESNECTGYRNCDFNNFEITKLPIQYKFKYAPEKFNQEMANEYGIDDHMMMLLKGNIHDIYLLSDKKIIIKNRSGFNYDHRGSNHTKIKLNFQPEITLIPVDGKIPFEQFIRACFDIKSHKFDFWYELYCGIGKIIKSDDAIEVIVEFDHGS